MEKRIFYYCPAAAFAPLHFKPTIESNSKRVATTTNFISVDVDLLKKVASGFQKFLFSKCWLNVLVLGLFSI